MVCFEVWEDTGGNLAAVLALKAVDDSFTPPLPKPLKLQLLIGPSVDQTATDSPGGLWESNKHAPYLPPTVVNWLKGMYFRNEEAWVKWEASPLLVPEKLIRKAPKAWIAAANVDILCNEAEAYAKKLNECGVNAEFVVYKGATHLTFYLTVSFSVTPRRNMNRITLSKSTGTQQAVAQGNEERREGDIRRSPYTCGSI
ncbi:hypothetical protein GYMLUDRAFT_1021758 [Collybiopsis luxurians FD-317 M1]|uniref:Unplaced genomic scaffold GYMLUscaffold_63, whole genome shotgun sequence n=1 Tax=Collybiopsis luxurians FD-317 M1 TaxID=944289 RepID=A0A0D0CA74_9AGAR|nr:hypothetical protein GYMLUDRAFT_1021758 [Collybiopsis luxurians FD-317 M1]